MSSILDVKASQRLDSRGNPTVQVHVRTDKGSFKAIVPSGASKGKYEAIELRDGDEAYHGKGVLKAVKNVNDVLGPAVIEQKFKLPDDIEKLDRFMIEKDGSDDKGNLGANAILGISMAAWRAAAGAESVPLYRFIHERSGGADKPYIMPVPFFNVLNGGVHSGNAMAFQEFMVAPVGAESITDAVRMGAEVYQELKSVIATKFGGSATGIGDEGGFAPPISQPHEALDLLTTAIENCNYTGKIKFGIDPASVEFFNEQDERYDLSFKQKNAAGMAKGKPKSRTEMMELYHALLDKYPIILLEDPFSEDDWQSWTEFRKTCPVELVGDDLLATNKRRIALAEEKKACTALLLKINQIGTITESIEAAKQAFSYGWRVFVSHRSGETTDDIIADITVGLGTMHLKSGSPCRGERVAKYNRLMDIEEELVHEKQDWSYGGPRLTERQ